MARLVKCSFMVAPRQIAFLGALSVDATLMQPGTGNTRQCQAINGTRLRVANVPDKALLVVSGSLGEVQGSDLKPLRKQLVGGLSSLSGTITL